MAIGIGSFVRVKPPFDEFYTGTFEIDAISETGAFQINGVDFSPEYLEEVMDGNHNP